MLVICAAVPAAAQDSELIGYRAVARNGAAGILVFNEDCDNRFPGVGGSPKCWSGAGAWAQHGFMDRKRRDDRGIPIDFGRWYFLSHADAEAFRRQ